MTRRSFWSRVLVSTLLTAAPCLCRIKHCKVKGRSPFMLPCVPMGHQVPPTHNGQRLLAIPGFQKLGDIKTRNRKEQLGFEHLLASALPLQPV